MDHIYGVPTNQDLGVRRAGRPELPLSEMAYLRQLATRLLSPNLHLPRKVKLSGSGARMSLHDEACLMLGWNNPPRGLFCRRSGRATIRSRHDHVVAPPGGYVMMERIAEASPGFKARIAGVFYLIGGLAYVVAENFVRGRLVVYGDAAATATNILAQEPLFRLGFASALICVACYIAVTALFYNLFKPVNRSLSLLAAFFSLVGCAILVFGSVFQLAPLVVLGGSQYLNVFKVEQLRALALMFLELNTQADNICVIFFGVYCLLIGYLIFRSAFLPRILGALMVFAGLGWLTFLSPPLANYLSPYNVVLGFFAELALCLWLLVMGVTFNDGRSRPAQRGDGDRSAPMHS